MRSEAAAGMTLSESWQLACLRAPSTTMPLSAPSVLLLKVCMTVGWLGHTYQGTLGYSRKLLPKLFGICRRQPDTEKWGHHDVQGPHWRRWRIQQGAAVLPMQGCPPNFILHRWCMVSYAEGRSVDHAQVKAALGGQQPEYSGWATYRCVWLLHALFCRKWEAFHPLRFLPSALMCYTVWFRGVGAGCRYLTCMHCCCCIRGMATWEEGIPDFAPEFCIMQGDNAVVGLYPLNPENRYYFYGFEISQVSSSCRYRTVVFCVPVMTCLWY